MNKIDQSYTTRTHLNTFLVTKPLQIMIALSIIDQLQIIGKSEVLVTNTFFNAEEVFSRMASSKWMFSEASFRFFNAIPGAFRHIRDSNAGALFLDGDVGFRRGIDLARIRIRRPGIIINIYEEGIGTYRTDLYSGTKKRIFPLLGIGTHFGECLATHHIYVIEPHTYAKNFPQAKNKILPIKRNVSDFIGEFKNEIEDIFGRPELNHPTSRECHIYLSSWGVDTDFLMLFKNLPGDKYIKLHPHIKEIEESLRDQILPQGAMPAELLLLEASRRYDLVYVYHHGTSSEHYIKNSNLTYKDISIIK